MRFVVVVVGTYYYLVYKVREVGKLVLYGVDWFIYKYEWSIYYELGI